MGVIYKDCINCYWYWENNDIESECQGQENPCEEFIQIKWNTNN